MKKLTALALSLVALGPAFADDDYYTTDFQYKLNTRTGINGFYDFSTAILGDGVSGSSTIQKYGFDVGVLDRLDIYFTSTSNAADLSRSNNYQFSFYSRAVGARFHILNENTDGFALTTGLSYETAYPGAVFKNGADLLISSPDSASMHGFLLMSKKVTDELRLNAGLKMGTAVTGPLRGLSYNWSLGAEYQFADDWSLQGNFKQIVLEGLPANNDLALRVNWTPTPNVRLQLHGDYYTRGLESQYPVLQPLIPNDAWQRFGTKPQAMIGLNASFTFEDDSDDRQKDEEPEVKPEEKPQDPPKENTQMVRPLATEPAPVVVVTPTPAPVGTAPVSVTSAPVQQAAPFVTPAPVVIVPPAPSSQTTTIVTAPVQEVRTTAQVVPAPKTISAVKPKLVQQRKAKKLAQKSTIIDDETREWGKAEDLTQYSKSVPSNDDW